MPYKDPEKKIEAMRQWRREVMPKGYGKWLYARRKLRFEDATRFGNATNDAVDHLLAALGGDDLDEVQEHVEQALNILQTALRESMEAEEELGPWKGSEDARKETKRRSSMDS